MIPRFILHIHLKAGLPFSDRQILLSPLNLIVVIITTYNIFTTLNFMTLLFDWRKYLLIAVFPFAASTLPVFAPIFKFLAWSSIAQSVCQRAFSLLAIWCLRTWWVRILHSAQEDNLSPFDSNTACLHQSIEINNNKHIYIKGFSERAVSNQSPCRLSDAYMMYFAENWANTWVISTTPILFSFASCTFLLHLSALHRFLGAGGQVKKKKLYSLFEVI